MQSLVAILCVVIQVREITRKIRDLHDKNPNKLVLSRQLLEKLYDLGVIPTADTLERCDRITASAFCRRRLPVVMVKLEMVQKVSNCDISMNFSSFIPRLHLNNILKNYVEITIIRIKIQFSRDNA